MHANLTTGPSGISPQPGDDLLALAVRHRFGGLDLPLESIQTIDAATALGERARRLGLSWGLFWLPCDFPSAEAVSHAQGMQRLRDMLPLVRAAGCTRTYNHLMPGDQELDVSARLGLLYERLRPVADLLGEYGVTYGLEFIGPATLRREFRHPSFHTLPAMMPLLDRLGPHAGVVLDLFHWWTSGGTCDELRQLLPHLRVVNVHANDGAAGRTRDEQLDGERELPLGSGLVDAAGVMGILAEIGYDGPVIAEPFNPHRDRLAALPAEVAAAEVSASLRRLLARAAPRRPVGASRPGVRPEPR